MGWEAAITAVFAFLLFVGEQWANKQPERLKEAADEKTQQGRADIVNGNVGAVDLRISGVLADTAGTADNPAGIANSEDVEKRLRAL